MDRLWSRLTLAFIAVIAVTLLTVAVLASNGVGVDFQQYLARRDALASSGLLDDLITFFEQNRSWNGVGTVVNAQVPSGPENGVGQGRGLMRGRPAVLVADSQGQIMYDSRNERVGQTLLASERDVSLPIVTGNQTVGYFVILPGQGNLLPADRNFLDNLQGTLVVAALIAGGVGLGLGLLFSRTVAKPLSALSTGASNFAQQNWSQRVPVRGTAEMRQVATAFNQMADALQQADLARRNLMADIAHELRTPLTVMQGTLHAMLDDVFPLEKSELTTVYDETRLLQRLVDDVRELALADAGQLTLALQPTNINALVDGAVNIFTVAAETKGVTVSTHIPAEKLTVNADPDRLSQILHNLLANALQHTQEGQIRITLETQTTPARVRVVVSDSGEGILPQDLPHVFDRFYRGHTGKANVGTGLGLPIAKTWIMVMGGEIGVESQPDKGSEFWFTLPLLFS